MTQDEVRALAAAMARANGHPNPGEYADAVIDAMAMSSDPNTPAVGASTPAEEQGQPAA